MGVSALLHTLAATGVGMLLVGRLRTLRHTPRDPALRALVAALVLLLVLTLLGGAGVTGTLFSTTGWSSVAARGLQVGTVLALALFFGYSGYSSARARRTGWWDVRIAATVLVGMVALVGLGGPGSGAAAVGLALSGGYTTVMLLRTGVWGLDYLGEVAGRMRPSPPMGTVGLWLCGLATAVGTTTALAPPGGQLPESVRAGLHRAYPVGTLLFTASLLYPTLLTRIAALRLWQRHWRTYRELEPLWRQLSAAFPEASPAPLRWWHRLPWRVHHRHWQRVIAIRDALLWLGPHLVDLGVTTQSTLPQQATGVIRALQRVHAGVAPTSNDIALVAVDDAAPAGAMLVRLSRAMG
ncbi:MAB_1171c family putative transporter [Actinopolyspora halophila]|uniref:MAB_1171c family putative transporter n=1 Tax=Actinopolyspora halophila TaxID=1850 RepID=UPI00037B77C8|nr:MAB_1171c family putative transporter [Actinopolyspora halophila]